MASKPIVTGARARFSINGTKVAFATGVTLREAIEYEPLNVLDNIETEEWVPTGYTVSATADYVRVVLESAKALGWFPQAGKNPAEHLTNILNQGEMTAQIEDVPTGKIIAQLTGVKISEKGLTINARNITGENVTFVAKVMRDEADLAS
jgi:hypothetical protein